MTGTHNTAATHCIHRRSMRSECTECQASFTPHLPPRTTQPTGWGREADRMVNLHGQVTA